MFERFTESARRTLFFARYEASQFGSLSIGTEHMLLGLIREGRGVVASVLTLQAMEAMRHEIHHRVAVREKIPTSVEIPFDEATKRALQYAAEEADLLRHSYIGPEHMLLGLMRDEASVGGSVLAAQGFRLPVVRASVLQAIEEEPSRAQTARSLAHEKIEWIKKLVGRLGDPASTAADRDGLVQQIDVLLDELSRGLGR
jgi:ATP-dependent Clp protease ATP-binding subunit ClpC